MNNNKLNLESIIETGRHKGKTVSQIIETDKKIIFDLLKNGYNFEEEVFEKARIKHFIRDEKIIQEIVDRSDIKDTKIYPKDTDNLRKIMESILTLNNDNYTYDKDDSLANVDEISDINNEYDEEV